jgi:hypothetical protein
MTVRDSEFAVVSVLHCFSNSSPRIGLMESSAEVEAAATDDPSSGGGTRRWASEGEPEDNCGCRHARYGKDVRVEHQFLQGWQQHRSPARQQP